MMKDTLMNPTSNVVIKSEPLLSNTDENSLQSSANSCASSNGTPKRPISLDISQATKKTQIIGETSDNQNMKSVGTPDLDKLLHLLPTPQPGRLFPSKSSSVTSEQEAFGKGFEEALHSLRNSKTSQIRAGTLCSDTTLTNPSPAAITPGALNEEAFTYTNLDIEKNFPINVKDEQQSQQTTAPVNRIDMEAQEKIKLERKRQRNRVAASKCRKRKLERISKLEERVKGLKNENSDLSLMAKNLKEHIAQLKQQVMEHVDSGCNIQALCATSLM